MNCRAGYTLVEVLIAVTLSAAVIATISSASWMVRRMVKIRENSDLEPAVSDGFRLDRFLSGSVWDSQPDGIRFVLDPDSEVILRSICYLGNPDRIQYGSDMALITITGNSGNGFRLTVDTGLGDGTGQVTTRVLFPGATRFRFTCLDPRDSWQESWDPADRPYLPSAIRLELLSGSFLNVLNRDWVVTIPAARVVR
ncbi:prepilin-type N-terminal cleavage/methylation domain-containing protein [bacterium]|nr:prepilin-type N-terminal cleavage/methylation domain-containing protein [candidate division CSSED10-310 bacterium]